MARRFWFALLILVICTGFIHAQDYTRTPVKIPDILGYKTLKCDFHMHTVFSDGTVWPDIRPAEAWMEGLDAISITEHLEHQAHDEDIPTNHNRSYDIAKTHGDAIDVTVVKGSEITRQMPPGHFNAIFLTDSEPLATPEWDDAFNAAKEQGAFIFWNHPGWKGQQSDGVAKWYNDHTKLLAEGKMHGMEIVNEREYYPEVHQWCIDKRLTILGNSDLHAPSNMFYSGHSGDHRPMTLVFAKDNKVESIKAALFDRRTAVYSGDKIYGDEKFLEEIFKQSIQILSNDLKIKFKQQLYIQVYNGSELPFELLRLEENEILEIPARIMLAPGEITAFTVKCIDKTEFGLKTVKLAYRNNNLIPAPNKSLDVDIELPIYF